MKKIFKYLYLYVALSAGFAMVSCEDLKFGKDFLQKPPSSDVTIDTIFSSAEYARRVLWYSYQSLPYGIETNGNGTAMHISTIEGLTDLNQSTLTYSKVNKYYYTGTYNAKEQESGNSKCPYGSNYWVAIRNAWLVIQNIDRVVDMDAVEKQRLKAEAKSIIAIYYSHMFRHFGALPIIDHALSAEDAMPVRATLQETLDFIVRLLDEAIATPEFPWRLSDSEMPNWYGRITKAGAMGLKARVLLFAASPLFNNDAPYYPGEAADKKMTWFGGYDKNRWKLAADACKEFFDAVAANGYYKLVEKNDAAGVYPGYKNEYRYAFRAAYFDRGTTETLISTHRNIFTTDDGLQLDQGMRWGAHNPTLEYLDMFQTADGEVLDWEAERAAGKNIFLNRDPRLYETLIVDSDEFRGRKLDLAEANPKNSSNYPQGKDYGKFPLDKRSLRSGCFSTRKWGLDRQGGGDYKGHIIQWSFLRMAELHLSYAEALNEYHGAPTELAYEHVDAVRARVGLKGLKKGLNKEDFRAALLRERACEFGWEEVRIFDLIRWKMSEKFTSPLHGLHMYRHKTTKQMVYEPFELTEGKRIWWEEGAFTSKWYLNAFPANEVNKGYGLTQNPGWE